LVAWPLWFLVSLFDFIVHHPEFAEAYIYIYSVGLPGGIGAVFVSRLSTDLHARGDDGKSEESFATGTILFTVGLPVLVTYLSFMYVVGWIDLPILFLVMFVLAFCISVSMPFVLRNENADEYFALFHRVFSLSSLFFLRTGSRVSCGQEAMIQIATAFQSIHLSWTLLGKVF